MELPFIIVVITIGFIVIDRFWIYKLKKIEVPLPYGAPVVPGGLGLTLDYVFKALCIASILIAALYVVLSKEYDDSSEKWAYGAIGSIITYLIKK